MNLGQTKHHTANFTEYSTAQGERVHSAAPVKKQHLNQSATDFRPNYTGSSERNR